MPSPLNQTTVLDRVKAFLKELGGFAGLDPVSAPRSGKLWAMGKRGRPLNEFEVRIIYKIETGRSCGQGTRSRYGESAKFPMRPMQRWEPSIIERGSSTT